jgi:hypothetical protein
MAGSIPRGPFIVASPSGRSGDDRPVKVSHNGGVIDTPSEYHVMLTLDESSMTGYLA